MAIPRNLPVFAHSNTFEPVEEIHILCDVVPQQIYGNTAKRLLACIAAVDKKKPLRSTVKHVFQNRHCVPLIPEILKMIKITVQGDAGQTDVVYDG